MRRRVTSKLLLGLRLFEIDVSNDLWRFCMRKSFIVSDIQLPGEKFVLTIFFDSLCPLCAKEMEALQRYDSADRIRLVDLHSEAFREQYPEVCFDAAMRVLHAEQNGKILKGLDVTAAAWKAVGKKPWVQCLRWPVIRWFADGAYILFANNRYRLSWLLTGQARCQDGACKIDRR